MSLHFAATADLTVIWGSDTAAVATVSAEGLVTGVADGSAVITVATVKGNHTATCAVTVDGTAPAEVMGLSAGSTKTSVMLAWTEPADADFAKAAISYTPGTAAAVEVLKGTTAREITGLSPDTVYVFTVKTVDALGNVSSGVTANVTTLSADGLVGEWLFSGSADDTSGEGNDGTVNGASLTTDRFGTANAAYSFDGTDDYVIAEADQLPTDARTVSLWFYTTVIRSDPGYYILGYGGSNNSDSYIMNLNDDYDPDCYNVESNETFMDGRTVGNKYLCIGIIVGLEGIGPYTDENGSYFFGKLDDIRIYDRALSADEILTLYREGGWDM